MRPGRIDGVITLALHGVSWLMLRVQPPRSALRNVGRIGGLARPFESIQEARAAAALLARRGTCLSRSVAIAARLPGSRVVIGVEPRWSGRLAAHAWVELEGETIEGPGAPVRSEPMAWL
jgi:Transglutaminase-like superfamily